MKTIDLKKYYYPICRKAALVELPDEVADAIVEAARAENANDAKQHYHCYSLDASPGIENHSPEQAISPLNSSMYLLFFSFFIPIIYILDSVSIIQ